MYLNFKIYDRPDDPVDMDYFFWVIRNAHRTVVVDTGFSDEGGRSRNRTFLIDPARAFELLGIDPASNPPVVITHAHYDHIGNLSLFPSSDVVLSQSEFDFWAGDLAMRQQFRHSVEAPEIEYLTQVAVEGRMRLFTGEFELAPGIRLLEVGGHTPGQVIVLVDTDEGQVVLASDAMHYYEELEQDLPFAFVSDLPKMYQGFDLIRRLTANHKSLLVSGHDPDTLNRFKPIDSEGELAGLAATIGSYEPDGMK